jgi:GTP-binding protein
VHPNLGVVYIGDRTGGDEFVLADLPGLIEGANEGAGLGTRFLGHVERCRVLVHLIDGTLDDVAGAYQTVCREVEAYGGGLAEKPKLVVLNKADSLSDEDKAEKQELLALASGAEVAVISGISGDGLQTLMAVLFGVIGRQTESTQPKRAFAP